MEHFIILKKNRVSITILTYSDGARVSWNISIFNLFLDECLSVCHWLFLTPTLIS